MNCTATKSNFSNEKNENYVMVIHGGAGNITKEKLSAEKIFSYEKGLRQALEAGKAKLDAGSSAVDAVEAAIRILEDNPLFNAGKGAVLTADGKAELDASIMDGFAHKAGAVAGVTIIKNPISTARLVMDSSAHVLLVSKGAEVFAQQKGVELVNNDYFKTTAKLEEHQSKFSNSDKFGTVGAVALDKNGHLAAGTSTGGMSGKKYGRVGDSPIIGAGTFADENVGVSCTGHGEYFIRNVIAYDVAARIKYKNENLNAATKGTIENLQKSGGTGGLIALDKNGNVAMPFNTSGMFRATLSKDGIIEVKMFGE